MADSEAVANSLIKFFLESNSFDELRSHGGGFHPVAAQATIGWIDQPEGFAGLSVRAVGYAEDAERSKCYLYLTKSSKKLESQIPSEIDGVEIQVRKVGKVFIKPEAAAAATNSGNSYRTSDGKITCGSSIGPVGEQSAGTLGALLRLNGSSEVYALSNNHVIGACNHMPVGKGVLAPSTIDGYPGAPVVSQFAVFNSLIELRSGRRSFVPEQEVDAALALVSDPSLVSSMQGNFYDTPTRIRDPIPGEKVFKVGRTTGMTAGIVESFIPTAFPLPYKSEKFTAVVSFKEVWLVRGIADSPFALRGDSGSLVVSEDKNFALGLVFAATLDGSSGFFCPMSKVLQAYPGYSIVSGI